MILYLIKSTLCLVLLWTFYKLFLEKEKIHHLKRFYLLFSLIFAYSIPLISITYESNTLKTVEELQQPVIYVVNTDSPVTHLAEPVNYTNIMWHIYAIGVLIFAGRFIRNIYHLVKRVKTNQNIKERSHVNVLLGSSVVPHTFLKYIFVDKKEFQQSTIPQEIWLHEKTHVIQKHTLDILLVEIFQAIFWFNPMWIWIKKSIRLNHEFLADQTVLKQKFSIRNYMDLLVMYPNGINQTELTSPINYSLTKKRIVMMSQQFSKTRATIKMLLLLPILFGCVMLFTNKIIAQPQQNISNTNYKEITSSNLDKKVEIKIIGEQITVNARSTDLKNFASSLDEISKQWNDEELASLNFNISLQNTDDTFIEKLNKEYKKTKLYTVYPDKQGFLVPPPPPLPPTAPIVKKGESSMIPVPPAKKAKKAKKSKKCKQTCKKTSKSTKAAQAMRKAHQNELKHSMEQVIKEAEMARNVAESARQEAEHIRAITMVETEKARELAMEEVSKIRAKSQIHQEEVMKIAETARFEANKQMKRHTIEAIKARKRAEKIRERVKIETKMARVEEKRARVEVKRARVEAQNARREGRKSAQRAEEEVQRVREEIKRTREEAERGKY